MNSMYTKSIEIEHDNNQLIKYTFSGMIFIEFEMCKKKGLAL